MSDRSSNMEIQDVLSSIRRLVSEDKSPQAALKTEQPNTSPSEDDQPGKLVLTPAHRVQDGEAAAEGDAAKVADGASLEETIAELEAAVASAGGDFEPDGSEVQKADTADADPDLERAFEHSFAVDVAAEEEQDSALSQPVTSGQVDEGDDTLDADPAPESTEDPDDTENEMASDDSISDPASKADDSQPDPDTSDTPAAVDMPSPAQLDALIAAETAAAAGAAFAARRLNLGAGDLARSGGAPWARTDAPEREDSATPDGPVPLGEQTHAAKTIDIEAEADAQILREIVADIVRQELQGPLGERITRSVRMLVRREINRALESRDFE
ncbi:MAG: hypothetical protein WBB85_09820 [Albidovulum sp.]|uniref:hypothetical protein n=1 Tax=Albidovulum sp. TaxID=1872424 RepID=UPI003C940A5F